MAKTYLDIVKYMIEANFSIEGLVDKPDIIGAIFGQTEGLLGDELDLRELQKNGKIGRIEIEYSQAENKTIGKLYLPTSLDRVDTCILAAAVEAVERVGPYDAKIVIDKIEDTRLERRRKIIERAKELVKELITKELPDSRELKELVQSDVKASEITTYGPENLPAGPDVGASSEVIVVEGRADVINLLRNDITNAIAIGGASTVPKTIIELSKEKEITAFIDGDRGGDLILRSLLSVADVDYVAKAPTGKEVEELSRKEIIKSLRNKITVEQYIAMNKELRNFLKNRAERNEENKEIKESKNNDIGSIEINEVDIPKINEQHDTSIEELRKANYPEQNPVIEGMLLDVFKRALDELSNTLNARFYDKAGNIILQKPTREVVSAVQDISDVYAIVLDGVVTQRLVDLAEQKHVKAIYATRANINRKPESLYIYTKEQGNL